MHRTVWSIGIFSLLCGVALAGVDEKSTFKDGYVKAGERGIHFIEKGQGPLILFLHGFPESAIAWSDQLSALSAFGRVVAIDLPGYGLSDQPKDVSSYSISSVSRDILAFTRALGYSKLSLIGHDWGGQIAWNIAINEPNAIERLVIINAPHPAIFCRELTKKNSGQKKSLEYITLIQNGRLNEEFYSANDFRNLKEVAFVSSDSDFFDSKMKARYVEAWRREGAVHSMLNYYRALPWPPDCDIKDSSIFKVGPPTLLIWGVDDIRMSVQNLTGLEAFVPKIKIARINGAGHSVIHEQSKKVTSLIHDFFLSGQAAK